MCVTNYFMQICQNGPIDKSMRFLFMRWSALCIGTYAWCDKNLCGMNLCDRGLTHIIHIN